MRPQKLRALVAAPSHPAEPWGPQRYTCGVTRRPAAHIAGKCAVSPVTSLSPNHDVVLLPSLRDSRAGGRATLAALWLPGLFLLPAACGPHCSS